MLTVEDLELLVAQARHNLRNVPSLVSAWGWSEMPLEFKRAAT